MAGRFHEGELRMQQMTGEERGAEANSPMIASRIASGAAPFLAQRSLAVFGVEDEGAVWCTFLIGAPGFVSAPEPSRLAFDLRKLAMPPDRRIVAAADGAGGAGTIFIDLRTRMRYRVNGTLSRPDPERLELRVREAYGNCPKYITQRIIMTDAAAAEDGETEAEGETLTEDQVAALRNCDVFFLASGHPERGLDASHRGGKPGFVSVLSGNRIAFPDYPGNSLYNTLGNLLVDNRIGILVPDWSRRRALRITGTAEVEFQSSVDHVSTDDGPRRVVVSILQWSEVAFPLTSSGSIEYSPFDP